jgi:hypothetical protein
VDPTTSPNFFASEREDFHCGTDELILITTQIIPISNHFLVATSLQPPLIKMTRFLSVLAALSVIVTPASAQPGAQPDIPDFSSLLALLPQECLMLVQTTVIPCFTSNPDCLQSLPTADDIGSLPAASDISSCEDVSEPVCPILAKCEPCLEELGDLLACVLAGAEDTPPETADLINGCAFDCEDVMGDMDMDMDMDPGMDMDMNVTEAPVTAPVAAPSAPVSAPTPTTDTAPTSTETTDAPTVSGLDLGTPAPSTAATTMALGVVSVIAAMSSLLLA